MFALRLKIQHCKLCTIVIPCLKLRELGPCAVPASEKEWLALGQVQSAVSLCLQRGRVDMWQDVMGGTRAWCTVFQVGTLC